MPSRPTNTPTDSESIAFLPLVENAPTSTPTLTPTAPPPLTWQSLGTTGGQPVALAVVGNTLLVADRSSANGGIYRADLTTCTVPDFRASFNLLWREASVYAITANQSIVLAGTEEKEVLRSGDGGTTWTRSNSDIEHRVFAVAIANGVSYAGSDDGSAGNARTGIFKRADGGSRWQQIPSSPKAINRLRPAPNTLWIGTKEQCAWRLNISDDALIQLCQGLPNDAAHTVHDIVVDSANNRVYLATSDGVYASDRDGPWESFGLSDIQIRSLTHVDQTLYAGTNTGGVRSRHLAIDAEWAAIEKFSSGIVRDLIYDSTNCRTLLAATDDGVWILR